MAMCRSLRAPTPIGTLPGDVQDTPYTHAYRRGNGPSEECRNGTDTCPVVRLVCPPAIDLNTTSFRIGTASPSCRQKFRQDPPPELTSDT